MPKFSSTHQPAVRGHRQKKAEEYARPVMHAEGQVIAVFPQIVQNLIDIALGKKTQWIVNNKTGEFLEVPVSAKDQKEAGEYLVNRIAGKPESTKTVELGAETQGTFQVLLGAAAAAHWKQLQPPGYVEGEVRVIAQEVAGAGDS